MEGINFIKDVLKHNITIARTTIPQNSTDFDSGKDNCMPLQTALFLNTRYFEENDMNIYNDKI